MSDYYQRSAILQLDGTRIFKSADDIRNEEEVAAILERAWKCRIVAFGALSPIDWHAERDGRLVGILELKSRPHAHDHYDTVFLNVRKWLALTLGAMGLGCPAIFVAKFIDGVWWTPLTAIDAAKNRVCGCARIVKSVNDIEPVIEIDIDRMRMLQQETNS